MITVDEQASAYGMRSAGTTYLTGLEVSTQGKGCASFSANEMPGVRVDETFRAAYQQNSVKQMENFFSAPKVADTRITVAC